MEGQGRSEIEFTDVETATESLHRCIIYHVVIDVLGFVLFMHQQIPSILQDISLEFDALHTEYKDLDAIMAQPDMKASLRRVHAGKKREVRMGIKKFEKLMKNVSNIQSALQLVISEIPDIKEVILVLGSSSVRPQHVYELCFSHGKVASGSDCDFLKTRAAEGLSRKAIRALVSKSAGSNSYAGPTKLFLLIKAPASFSQPVHFLPKRDFRYNKKILPLRLRFKCRNQNRELDAPRLGSLTASSTDLVDKNSDDLIWFQCRHVIKGMACRTSPTEE
ncbi:Melanoma inhibitory activity protein [Heracleum sosnowskyi]|uniref:Melanoma inhibitory activity protein n=1 Tax=Heracleum sosnowskyi TaxID=360622 RepID=A0AAD8N900_9APIA|nr:Melanoma inhibitory activity protein [Heracleum sosnowskyi]